MFQLNDYVTILSNILVKYLFLKLILFQNHTKRIENILQSLFENFDNISLAYIPPIDKYYLFTAGLLIRIGIERHSLDTIKSASFGNISLNVHCYYFGTIR